MKAFFKYMICNIFDHQMDIKVIKRKGVAKAYLKCIRCPHKEEVKKKNG